MAHLLEVAFNGSIRGGAVLHSIAKGEAWKGLVVACFDCSEPGGWEWATSRSVVETDKRADAGKVIRAGGQALIKLLPIGQLYRTGWPPLAPDAVSVSVGDWCCWRG